MENTRTFLVIADNSVKLRVVATTKWQALDIAFNKYPQYESFQNTNVVRTRKAQAIIDKM